jgi:transcriptional regulator with XRE-family HTH domain
MSIGSQNKMGILPEIQGKVLKAAREKLKLEIKDLALKACLSKKHITELEEGGTSSFYSESHKILVAKKVAKMLKVDEALVLIHPDGDSVQQVSMSFDAPVDEADQIFKTQETKAARYIREITAEARLTVESSNQVKIKPTVKSESSQPTKVTLENLQSGGQIDSSRPKTKRSLSGLVSVLLLILVAGGLYSSKNTIIALFSPPAAEPQAVVVDGAAPQDPKEEGVNPVNPVSPSAPSAAAPAAVSVAAVPPLPSDVSCPKPDASVTEQSVTEPNKPGNFVHVHAKSRQIVCVVDATGKSMMQSIEAGTGHTYGGKAPFTILSNGLSQTSVYFQGKLVRPNNEQARTMRVVEVSAN